MATYRGITWDHPRGYNALAAAAARLRGSADGLSIHWDRQRLEGFESRSIAELCAQYDLIVLDHPHVGEAVVRRCLRPLEELFDPALISALAASTIGPSGRSYYYANRHWALSIDAATQVMAVRPDLLEPPHPQTWSEVADLARATSRVAVSLAGPHAILTFMSIAAAFGNLPATVDPELFVSDEEGEQVYGLLSELAACCPTSVAEANPIGLLDHMTQADDVLFCPLVFGYVTYASINRARRIQFVDAPRAHAGGRCGSTLGGTGIGISARCQPCDALKRHLLWLAGDDAQLGFMPNHDGQPSSRRAWLDSGVNRPFGDFYRNTANTIESAYVRPRHAGYIEFQQRASQFLRQALQSRARAPDTIRELQSLYRKSLERPTDTRNQS